MVRRRDDDESTVLTIDTLDPSPTEHEPSRRASTTNRASRVSADYAAEWTPAQERQLANAREVALRNRRERLQTKLQQRLSELNSQLGFVSAPHMEKIAHAMMQQEESLRLRTNTHLKEISTQIRDLKASLPASSSR